MIEGTNAQGYFYRVEDRRRLGVGWFAEVSRWNEDRELLKVEAKSGFADQAAALAWAQNYRERSLAPMLAVGALLGLGVVVVIALADAGENAELRRYQGRRR